MASDGAEADIAPLVATLTASCTECAERLDRLRGDPMSGSMFEDRIYTQVDSTFSDGTPLPEPSDDMGAHNDHRYADSRGSVAVMSTAIEGEPTTWEAVDLGPFLRGEVEVPTPSIGRMGRTDGNSSTPAGSTPSSGKLKAERRGWRSRAWSPNSSAGRTVVYVHFEESDPSSTIERLLRIGLRADIIQAQLRFVAPSPRSSSRMARRTPRRGTVARHSRRRQRRLDLARRQGGHGGLVDVPPAGEQALS